MKYIFIVIIFLYLVIYIFGVRMPSHEEIIENQCREYEQQKVIPENSCDCTSKLFKTWGESYDWKDSCEILKHRD